MQVANADAGLLQVRCELFRHSLGQRGDDHAFATCDPLLDPPHQIVNLSNSWHNGDLRINHTCWADELFHHALLLGHLVASRSGRDVDRLAHAPLKLLERERAIVERAREAEAKVHEDLLPRAIVLIHANHLRDAHVALIDHQKPISREVVEQCPWTRPWLTAREVAGVVLNPRAVPHLAHHLKVKGGSLSETRRLENLPGGLQLPAARLHLLLNVANRFSEFLRWGHIVRCGVDHHLVPLGENLTRERVHLCNALYFITEKLHTENRLFTRRLHLNGVPTHAELRAAEGGVIPLILQVHEVTQDGIAAVLPRFAHTQDGCPVVNRCAEAVDATYGGHNDRVAPLKERLRCRMTQLVDLLIAT